MRNHRCAVSHQAGNVGCGSSIAMPFGARMDQASNVRGEYPDESFVGAASSALSGTGQFIARLLKFAARPRVRIRFGARLQAIGVEMPAKYKSSSKAAGCSPSTTCIDLFARHWAARRWGESHGARLEFVRLDEGWRKHILIIGHSEWCADEGVRSTALELAPDHSVACPCTGQRWHIASIAIEQKQYQFKWQHQRRHWAQSRTWTVLRSSYDVWTEVWPWRCRAQRQIIGNFHSIDRKEIK